MEQTAAEATAAISSRTTYFCSHCGVFSTQNQMKMNEHLSRCLRCKEAGVCSVCGLLSGAAAVARRHTGYNLCWACHNAYF